MLSEDYIKGLAKAYSTSDGILTIGAFARAIEREAYRAGQESMRERAMTVAAVCVENNTPIYIAAQKIRNLPIEELK